MKIEPRGKYPGVKIHLDKEECEALLELRIEIKKAAYDQPALLVRARKFAMEVANMIRSAQNERPSLLEERTEDEIKHELEVEMEKSKQKLEALAKGKDWKKVKVPE